MRTPMEDKNSLCWLARYITMDKILSTTLISTNLISPVPPYYIYFISSWIKVLYACQLLHKSNIRACMRWQFCVIWIFSGTLHNRLLIIGFSGLKQELGFLALQVNYCSIFTAWGPNMGLDLIWVYFYFWCETQISSEP